MARRPPPEPQRPQLTVAEKRQGIERLKRRIVELEAFDPNALTQRFSPEQTAIQTAIKETLEAIFGNGTPECRRYLSATRLDNGPIPMGGSWLGRGPRTDPRYDAQRYVTEGKARALALLNQAVRGLEEEIEFHAPEITGFLGPAQNPELNRSVFVVHGHDEGVKNSVARFLDKIGLQPIILAEQPNQGRTIIEKFEAHSDVGFAVVLLSPDDEGCAKGKEVQPRARQNVILELGYFIGKLGRARVCALKSAGLEIPSDILGVVWTEYDANGGWQKGLAQELQAAGYDIDWNKIMRS